MDLCSDCKRRRGPGYLKTCLNRSWHLTPSEAPPKIIASVALTQEMHDQMDGAAKRMGVNRSEFMRLAIESFLTDDLTYDVA